MILATKKKAELSIAVVGCGNWGKNLIRVVHELGNLHSVCDIDTHKAVKYSEQFDVPHNTFHKLLSCPDIQAILIATPSTTHYELAKQALLAGKHVFVEKPLAISIDDACHLYELATQMDRILMVGHLLQYHLAFNALKQLNNSGTLGKLQNIYSNRLNLGKFRTEENIWWDFAPHDVSMILSLVKEMPDCVFAMGGNYLKHTITDVTCTQLSFPSGTQAHIFVSWLHPYKEQKLVVVGEKAMAVFNDCAPWEEKLKLYPYPVEWVDGLPQPWQSHAQNISLTPQEPLKNEIEHFIECIKEHRAPLTDGMEGLQVMRILNAAIQSIESKQPINLSQEPPLRKQKGIDNENLNKLLNKALQNLDPALRRKLLSSTVD